MRSKRALTTGLVASTLVLAGCSASDEGPASGLPADAVVSYAYHDSSVPPPYHRSESLTVTEGQAHLVIDSYGEILADERVPTPAEVWDTLGSTLPSVQGLEAQDEDEGCTGGTGMDLVVARGDETLVELRPLFCGGSNEELQAPITAWIAPARDLFPPTDELAPEGE